jgi:DNA-binding NarL/FixJ family response regulator
MSETIYISENGNRREATADETAYILKTQQELQTQSAVQEQSTADAITARQSAIAKLAKLGLTADEISALLS